MSAIKQLHYCPDYTWTSGGTPTWVALTDFLAEDFEPGMVTPDEVEMGEGGSEQDGVTMEGSVLVSTAGGTAPTPGTRYWFRVTPFSGNAQVVGGTLGCRVKVGKSSLRPKGGGPAYHRITFSCTGNTHSDCIEDDQSP